MYFLSEKIYIRNSEILNPNKKEISFSFNRMSHLYSEGVTHLDPEARLFLKKFLKITFFLYSRESSKINIFHREKILTHNL